ncbi:NHL domain repeat-containing protein [Campylobacter iguaniorum]|uniref:hypothetical protein n=1 Tax=Campylobacter iguaniorum TaxID=1244531 RepID=UPI0007C923ED|nr:hypothetical protein [Campylobacter iguaniorum]ANE35882.1 NHL domain repeat-containing protein [Campylobacter iguaniorum]
MKKTLVAFSIVSSLALSLQAKEQIKIEVSNLSNPESVFVMNKNVYVSQLGAKLDPLSKDGDGFISKLDYNGKVISKEFIKGLNAPKGLLVDSGKISVANIDEIKIFDEKSGEKLLFIPIKDSIFLNHITKLNQNEALVSDTGTGIIHKINLTQKSYEEFAKMDVKTEGGPNGMAMVNGELFVAGYDPNGKNPASFVKFDGSKFTQVNDLKGSFDGLVVDKNGNIYISDWVDAKNGVVYKVDKNGYKKLDLPAMQGPADIFYDGKYLWIPQMISGKLLKVKL